MKRAIPKSKGVIDLKRFSIPYRIYGEGESIVCINGAQQSTAMWLSFLKYFSNKYEIILFDFPHQGKAKVKEGPISVSLDEQVEILHAVIRKLNVEKPSVCSASWGGVIALSFALKYPDDVRRLVLASIGLRPSDKMRSAILKGVSVEKSDRKKMAKVLIDGFGSRLPDKVKNQIIAQFKLMSSDKIKAFSEHGLSVLLKDSLEKVLPLEKIKTPTVIIYGKEDMIINYEDAKKLSDKLPKAEIKTIDDTGHFLHLEDEQVLRIYEDILAA